MLYYHYQRKLDLSSKKYGWAYASRNIQLRQEGWYLIYDPSPLFGLTGGRT
jgi:hypothetical protein